MSDSLLLRSRPVAGGWELLSPGVGYYAQAPELGARRGPGDVAGVLVVLERAYRLLLPEGVAGYVATRPPERKHLPAGYGTLLFVMRAEAEAASAAAPAGAAGHGERVLRAPQAGRFWRRPEPKAPPYLKDGDELAPGRTYGLLEVMKTFNPIKYAGAAPVRMRRFLVEDGGEVEEGQPLIELE